MVGDREPALRWPLRYVVDAGGVRVWWLVVCSVVALGWVAVGVAVGSVLCLVIGALIAAQVVFYGARRRRR